MHDHVDLLRFLPCCRNDYLTDTLQLSVANLLRCHTHHIQQKLIHTGASWHVLALAASAMRELPPFYLLESVGYPFVKLQSAATAQRDPHQGKVLYCHVTSNPQHACLPMDSNQVTAAALPITRRLQQQCDAGPVLYVDDAAPNIAYTGRKTSTSKSPCLRLR